MGQRHQAFLVARIVPHGETKPRYRCVGAYHHQWCYGTLPLRAVRRFLTLVKQKKNAEIIREELRAIDGQYGRFEQEPDIVAIPCPFATSLLGISWTVDLTAESPEVAYVSGRMRMVDDILTANVSSWETDNDDGITVIDISDPEDPAFCFLTDTAPLDAEQYLSGYYEIPKEEPGKVIDDSNGGLLLKLIASLEGETPLPPEALCEAWPTEYELADSRDTDSSTDSEDEDEDNDTQGTAPPPSLADMSLPSALTYALEKCDTSSIEETSSLLGKSDQVLELLRARSPFPDAGISLLSTILQQQSDPSDVDLSGMQLSDSQVVSLMERCPDVLSLNLSRNSLVTLTAIDQLLARTPRLKRLVIMNCPAIPPDHIMALHTLKPQLFCHLEALFHPAFLAIGTTNDGIAPYWAPAITLGSMHSMGPTFRGVSLPVFSPTAVVQGLTDYLLALREMEFSDFSMIGGNAAVAAFTAAARGSEKPWSERTIVAVPRLSLARPPIGHSWMFIMICDMYRLATNGWAFLRLPKIADMDEAKEDPAVASAAEDKDEPTATMDVPIAAANPTNDEPALSFVTDGGVKVEVHDLRGFLRVCAQDGRPEVPADIVARAEELIEKLAQGDPNAAVMKPQVSLLSPEGARKCYERILQGDKFY